MGANVIVESGLQSASVVMPVYDQAAGEGGLSPAIAGLAPQTEKRGLSATSEQYTA